MWQYETAADVQILDREIEIEWASNESRKWFNRFIILNSSFILLKRETGGLAIASLP